MTDSEVREGVKISKGRSPAYPYIPLQKAVERVQKIADAGVGKNPYPPETFYKLWGFGAQSSGARQTMAALNHFGLVQYVGRGKDRKVMLSDLARRIVMDKVPNSAARQKALREAALVPPIHADMWEQYRSLLPDDVVLTTYLTLERDYNDDAAKSLISEYRDTLTYAGLDKPGFQPVEQADDEVKSDQFAVGDFVNWESGGQLQWRVPWIVRELQDHDDGETYLKVEGVGADIGQSGWIPAGEARAPEDDGGDAGQVFAPPAPSLRSVSQQVKISDEMKEEKNSLDEGEAILIWPKNLSAESVVDLEYWLAGILRKAKRRAGLVAENTSVDDTVDEKQD